MNSQEKYNQKQQDKLECYRFKFAGQKIVCCATSADVNVADYFDFTNIKPEEINFGVHGDQYIKAKARNKHTGEMKDCFLKWVNREATIVSYKENQWTEEMAGKMLWPHIPNEDVLEKVRKGYEGKNLREIEIKMATGKFPSKIDIENPISIFNKNLKEHLKKVKDNLPQSLEEMNFKTFVSDYLNGLRDMLIQKNKSYGNAALDPVRVFSTADSEEQIKVRIDDKLSRIQRGNNSFNEDTIKDLIGYLVLLQYKKSQE